MATQHGGTLPEGTGRRVYRTAPARVVGVLLALGTLVLGGVALSADAGRGVLGTLAVVAVVEALVWVVLLRPAVVVDDAGAQVRNLLTDVTVPWEAVGEVGSQWALEVTDTAGHTHSAWAVPVKREWRMRTARDEFAEATTRARSREGVHARRVAGEVEGRRQQWLREGGRTRAGTAAHRRWAVAALLPLGAALAVALVALLV